MKETGRGRDQPLLADDEAPEVPQPGKGPFNHPTPSITPPFPAILMARVLVVPPRGDDGLNPPVGQPGAQGVAVVAPIGDQPLRACAGPAGFTGPPDGDRVEGRFKAGDFRRGRRLHVCSQRRTRALDQNPPRCPLAPFRRADFGPPFVAGMKLPSRKHASQRRFCWSLSWARRARQSLSSRPVSSQCLSRRQQVLGLPYRRGRSLPWAPVQRIHKMPSKQRRSSTRGRPPRIDGFGWGKWTRIASHWCLGTPRHAMSCLLLIVWQFIAS
jgi:hypothetical protein